MQNRRNLTGAMPTSWQRRIQGWIQTAAARWHTIAASGDGGRYQVGDEDEGVSFQDPAQLYQHYGFRSRPGATAEAVTVAGRGAPSQRMIIATRDGSSLPPELADWEVDLYARGGSRVLLREDGRILATPQSGMVEVDGDLQARHLVLQGGPPVAVANNNNLANVLAGGSNGRATVAFSVANAPATGPLFTLTFTTPFPSAVVSSLCMLTSFNPAVWNASAQALGGALSWLPTSTGVQVFILGGAGFLVGTGYVMTIWTDGMA